MTDEWDAAEYQRRKRDFVESRLLRRFVYLHAALIFTVTWLAGWLASWVLLRAGLVHMPGRYALAFLFSYLVFVAVVRVWADFMRQERGSGEVPIDMPLVDAEGCGIVLVVALAALVIAALFAASGGLPLLLEAAFEVVFAGVVVRRARRRQVLGEWARVLVRNTWIHALVVLLLLVAVAGWLQHRVPEAQTFAQAVRVLVDGRR